MNYHYMITELGLDTLDKYKAYTYQYMKQSAVVQAPFDPTTDDGTHLHTMNTWLNTETQETWVLMYKTRNGNFWWKFSRLFEKTADRCYKDIMYDYEEYVLKFQKTPER